MKDYRILFGYAAILLALSFFVRSFSPANAYNGPMVKSGENPSRSFYGTVSQSSHSDLLTTASDEVFVITSCYLQSSAYMDIYASSTKILEGDINRCSSQNSPMSYGRGRLIVSSGTTLRLTNSYPHQGYKYYIEGYYAYAP